MQLEKMPSDAEANKFGVDPPTPDFVFGTNYDSVFHMVTNEQHHGGKSCPV